MEEQQQPLKARDGHSCTGRVAAVTSGSPAAGAGITPGDTLLSIDGHELRDVLDYQFLLEPGSQQLLLERDGRQLELALEHGHEDPGISFESAIFDRVRTCACDCIFCFVDQLPPSLRPSLYIRDDDFRLSFMDGNFITLNNLSDRDIERIVHQRLTPLHVSVHATDTAVRARLMGVRESAAARGLENLRRLGQGGIEAHAQVVLCPGINDGAVLRQTITQLADDYPGIASVGVVPVSIGGEYLEAHAAAGLRAVDVDGSREIIAMVTEIQRRLRKSRGHGFVYAADEFYLLASARLPGSEEYDGYPQYENGIGIAASFRDNLEELKRQLPDDIRREKNIYLLTGRLAAGTVRAACGVLGRGGGATFRPLVAANHLFGDHVTVTGLLGGKDVMRATGDTRLERDDLLLLPTSCLSGKERPRFLDGIYLAEVDEALPCPVIACPTV